MSSRFDKGPSGQALETRETLVLPEAAFDNLWAVGDLAAELKKFIEEIRLSTDVVDSTIQEYESRFSEIILNIDSEIKALDEALVLAEAEGEEALFGDLLVDESVQMKERLEGLRLLREELDRMKKQILDLLQNRELERSVETEEQEKRLRFVQGLRRSGIPVQKLFSYIEEIDPEEAEGLLLGLSSPDLDKLLSASEMNYQKTVFNIALDRIRVMEPSPKLQAMQLVFRIADNPKVLDIANANDIEKTDKVSRIKELLQGDGFSVEEKKVATIYLNLFNSNKIEAGRLLLKKEEESELLKQEPILAEREVEALKVRDAEKRKVLLENLQMNDLLEFLENENLSTEELSDKIAEEILKRKRPYGESWPSLTKREMIFLPKDVLDRVVDAMTYSDISEIMAVDRRVKPPIFWSESFGEKLLELKSRHRALSENHVFEQTSRNSLERADSPLGKLWGEYKKKDDELFQFVRAKQENAFAKELYDLRNTRNRLFQDEVESIVERVRIGKALRGDISQSTNFQIGQRRDRVSISEDNISFNGYPLFPSDEDIAARKYGDRPVVGLEGNTRFDMRDEEFLTLSPEKKEAYQKIQFLEVQNIIAELYRATEYLTIPKDLENSTRDTEIRKKVGETAIIIEKDFAGLDAELEPLSLEGQNLDQDVNTFREKMRRLSDPNCTSEEAKQLEEELRNLQSRMKTYAENCRALMQRADRWSGYGSESRVDVIGDVLDEEKKSWDQKIDRQTQAFRRGRDLIDFNNIVVAKFNERKLALETRVRDRLLSFQRETQEKERQLQNVVSLLERKCRDQGEIDTSISNLERGIAANIKLIEDANSVVVGIADALEKNKAIKFGSLFGRKQSISYYDENGFRSLPEVSSEQLEDYTGQMKELSSKKEIEIAGARERLTKFRSQLESFRTDIETSYQSAVQTLRSLEESDISISTRLNEAARRKNLLLARIAKIIS
jgi:hypothetical protein